jgi:hypothetical protein
VLRRIWERKRDTVTGGCRKLHTKELYNSHFLSNITQLIKSSIMRWVGHVEGEKCF